MANAITTPQFDAPFRLDATGVPVTVEQDSIADIAACVYNILSCPQGFKTGDPQFGIPPLLFKTVPLNVTGIAAAIQRLEPRATTQIIASGLATQNIGVTVTAAAASITSPRTPR